MTLSPWIEEVFRKASADEAASRKHWESRRVEVEQSLAGLEKDTILSGREEDMGPGR